MLFPCRVATRVRTLVAAGISAATTSSACPTHVVEHAASVMVMHRTSVNTPRPKRLLFFILPPIFSNPASSRILTRQIHPKLRDPTAARKSKQLSPPLQRWAPINPTKCPGQESRRTGTSPGLSNYYRDKTTGLIPTATVFPEIAPGALEDVIS